MTLDEFRTEIKKRRLEHESYESIGSRYGLKRSMVKYIETHENYKPSKKINKLLRLDPPARLRATRKRNRIMDLIAQEMGYTSWSNYGTHLRKEWEKRHEL